jgi:hypothetical protein
MESILSTRRGFGQGIPDDPSTDEDVRKAPLVFIPVFHGPVKVVTGRS